MIYDIPLICSSIVSSIIMFQTILIAPAINKRINSKEASVFLRFIWPKFFLIIGIISLVSAVCLFLFNIEQNVAKISSISSLVLMSICYIITPVINNAKEIFILCFGNEKRKKYEEVLLDPDDYNSIPARLVLDRNWVFDIDQQIDFKK